MQKTTSESVTSQVGISLREDYQLDTEIIPQTGVTSRASISLMEDYRLGTEITPQTGITQLANANGDSELFYAGTDGQRGTVIYNVYPDAASDTGWGVNAISPNFMPGQISGGASKTVFTLFCVGPDVSNPDISYAQRDASGNWGSWTHIDPSSVFNNQTGPVYIRSITTEVTTDGTLELAVILNDANGQLTIWRVDWDGTLGGWQNLGNVDSTFLDICTTLPWGVGVLGAQNNATLPTAMDVMFFSLDGKTTATVASQQFFRQADSALQQPTGSGQGYSGLFLYNDGLAGGSKGVSFIDCGVASPTPIVIDTTLTCEQIVAVNAGPNPILFAALDVHMRLNIISQQESGSWNPAFELGETLSSITAGIAADGAPLFFAVDAKGSNLYSMQQQPDSLGGEWAKQQIEAQVQTVEKIEVYGTTLTLMDGAGNLLTNTALSVTSPETTVISWLGDTYVIGNNKSASLTTNANAQVTLYAPTQTINASKLAFSAPGLMNDGDAIIVDADDDVTARLKNLTVAETVGLLPSQFRQDAAQVQQAVTAAMSYTPAPGARGNRKGVRYVAAAAKTAGHRRPLDPASGRVKHWTFSVQGGRATFRELSAGEAQALSEQVLAGATGTPNHLDGLFDWLGDIVDAVADGVESAFTYIVSEVGGALKATINCIINGITYVFDGVIETIEKAYQVAVSILNSVEVFFEQLFDFLAWLLSGARQDIWNTKKVFEGIINQSFSSLTALAQQGQSAAPGFFAGLKQTVSSNFEAAIAAVGNDNFDYNSDAFRLALAGTGQAGSLDLSPGDIVQFVEDAAVKANWLWDKLSSPLGSFDVDTSVPQDVIAAFTSFSNQLQASVGTDIQNEINAVVAYLGSVAASPADFMSSTMKLMLQTVENLVLLVLDICDALTQAFLALVISFLQAAQADIFDQKIGGFFLGALYDLLNPEGSEDLTVTRLVSIIAAFPTTIIYRLINGTAPDFPSENLAQLDAPNAANKYKQWGGILMASGWAFIDTALDIPDKSSTQPAGAADPFKKALLIISGPVQMLLNGLLSPGATPFTMLPEGTGTGANQATNNLWLYKWGPIGYASIYKAVEQFKKGPRGEPASCLLLSLLGVVVLGGGIWKTVEEGEAGTLNPALGFLNIAPPLVTMAKMLRFTEEPLGIIALLAIDLVGDVGAGVITYVRASG
jgi:hypothetical protein